MSLEEQKSMSRRFIELWGSDSTDQPSDFVTANFISHQIPDPASSGASTKSREEWETLLKDFHEAFTDGSVRVLMQIAENDLVANQFEFTATQVKGFRDSSSTGSKKWTGVQTDRYEDGRIAENWVNWDKLGFLEGSG